MKIIDLLNLLKFKKCCTVFLTIYCYDNKEMCICGTVKEIIAYVLENNLSNNLVCNYLESFSKRTIHIDCVL